MYKSAAALRARSGLPRMLVLCVALAPSYLFAAAAGTVDLLATPPEITASVAPNVALTFDDSGSMAWEYMPDQRPYQSPVIEWVQDSAFDREDSDDWFCAGRIDSRVTGSTSPRAQPMNGMYYDPNVTYNPPLKVDGVTEFPDATFTAAWNNGIAHNRPQSAQTSGTRNLATSRYCARTHHQLAAGSFSQNWNDVGLITNDNDWSRVAYLTGYRGDDDTNIIGIDPGAELQRGDRTVNVKANVTAPSAYSSTDRNFGVFEVSGGTEISSNPTIALQPNSATSNRDARAPNLILRLDTTSCTNVTLTYKLRDIDTGTSATQPIAIQLRDTTTNSRSDFTTIRLVPNANLGTTVSYSNVLPTAFNNKRKIEIRWLATNSANSNDAMIGIDDIGVTGTCGTPVTDIPAGAGYFQLKSTVVLNTDTFGRITNGPAALYDRNNWEWVALPVAQQQNFANWYSYYRSRRNSAITAMSRAFAPFDANIRVVWQNLGGVCDTDPFTLCNPLQPLLGDTPIYKFIDGAATNNARTAFYNWLFSIPARGGTPNVAATNRVGKYFTRAGGLVATNPYFDPDFGVPGVGMELTCRQNFHINMSDGFWNGGNPAPEVVSDGGSGDQGLRYLSSTITLPDGKTYSPSVGEAKIFHRYNGTTTFRPNIADVMFHYWASNLRPDFAGLNVPPFMPDRSTNLFGVAVGSGQNARDNREIYWNPANDPATWPHLVNFNISFGLDGTLPQTPEAYEALRRGDDPNLIWPYPANVDDPRKLDDFWHAALVSRGRFLSAKNPEELITSLQEVIASIVARRGAATAVSVSLPIITDGTTGYTAGYDTADWSGFLTRDTLDLQTAERIGVQWDAGCKLTGGACSTTAQTGLPVRDPNTRQIITSTGNAASGMPFRWDSLTAGQQARLNVNPSTIRLDLNTWTTDTFGELRLDYVRGRRTNETTANPRFRQRSSVLGAVIRGQPVYVSSPTAGYPDAFPDGSPEAIAAEPPLNNSYAAYQVANRQRAPTVYVASNDGMLHAFDAANGNERFAYVPNAVIENFRLTRSTMVDGGFTPTVDDKPLVTDAFLNNQWRTVLLGSLRLGGRGVYLLDITNPTAVTEGAAGILPLWEFSNVAPAGHTGVDCGMGARYCSSLGYTYDSVNIARINYQNKWVALVSSGYFPTDSLDPASNSPKAAQTSLMVIDLATGTLIREMVTSTAPQWSAGMQTFGLSQSIVLDTGTDFIDDVAIAGDLAGNLWRFDLSGSSPSDWKVDLMFKTYGTGGSTAVGEQPIGSAPTIMADASRRSPMIVFGTGKFIGALDRTTAIPQQSFYGLQDYGTCNTTSNPAACAIYPIQPNQLIVRKIDQTTANVRSIRDGTVEPVPTTPRGWRIRLDTEQGERAFDSPFPFFSSNQVLLRSIIPKGVDPCNPGAKYGLMVVNAANGTAYVDPSESSPTRVVGGVVATSTPPGEPITLRGGGNVVIAGLTERDGSGGIVNAAVVDAINRSLSRADDIWHRGAWREILSQ